MKKYKTGSGITEQAWQLAETETEMREMLAVLAAVEYSGDFARAAKVAEEVARSVANEASEELVFSDSPQAFANSILQAVRVSKKAIEEGNSDLAAAMGFYAGVTWERAKMKWAWEEDALRGEKVAGGAKNSAHRTNLNHAQRRAQRMTRMAELTAQGLNLSCAAAQCEVEGLGKTGAIRQQWYRHRKL